MHVWRSTRTIPSARLNDAPVGQTSTHGGSAQCWHIIGNERVSPLWWVISILRIHCDDAHRRLRLVGVAFEAIELHRGVAVAAFAEGIVAAGDTTRFLARMTSD